MSPKLMTSKGVIAGKDMDECERVDTGGGVEPREGGDPECEIGRDGVGRELSPGEAWRVIPSGRRERIEASVPGSASNHARRQRAWRVLALVRRDAAAGGCAVGPTLAPGIWRREGVTVHHDTLRRWMRGL
jgi:hypothetical protein